MIEDAAEALGADLPRPAARDASATSASFSFNGNKIITTSRRRHARLRRRRGSSTRARYLATQARDPVPHYEHSEVGFNYRLSNLLAALGRGQLRSAGARVDARRAIIDVLPGSALGDLAGIAFMPEADYGGPTVGSRCITIDPTSSAPTREDGARSRSRPTNIEARPGVEAAAPAAGVSGSRLAPSAAPWPRSCSHAASACPAGSSLSDDDRLRTADAILAACQPPSPVPHARRRALGPTCLDCSTPRALMRHDEQERHRALAEGNRALPFNGPGDIRTTRTDSPANVAGGVLRVRRGAGHRVASGLLME